MHDIDDILDCALKEGLINDPKNFEVLAAICNCSLDVIRGFALGVTHRLDLESTPEDHDSIESLKEKKGLLEEQLLQVEQAIRTKRSIGAETPRQKRQKIEVKWEHHEYLPREIEPLPLLKSPKPKSESKLRRKSHLIRVRLYCAHCERFFYAKPTKRVNLHVLNHQCNGDKRKQFVVGRHHRRCSYSHSADVPCIDFAPKGFEKNVGKAVKVEKRTRLKQARVKHEPKDL